MNPPIFLALDLDDKEAVMEMAELTRPYVGGVKVGPRLCVKYGASLIAELSLRNQVFVDNKYFDIPSTMEASIQATFEAGASFATIHAMCGKEALKRLAELEESLNQKRAFKILAVTILTSFHSENLPANWSREAISEQVKQLAREVTQAGLKGLVCSAHEVRGLREEFPQSFLVTPGIRFPDEESQEQSRMGGPVEALNEGASALVVGRPICRSENCVEAAQRFFQAVMSVNGVGTGS